MQKIFKNGTKVLKKIQLNNKIFKIMKTIYQVLYKGTASNKIYLDEFYNYADYRNVLKGIKESEFYLVMLTNIYKEQ